MAGPITWRSLGGPNFGGVAQQGSLGSQALNQGFNQLGNVAEQVQNQNIAVDDRQKALNTARLLQEVNSLGSADAVKAAGSRFNVDNLLKETGGLVDMENVLKAYTGRTGAIQDQALKDMSFTQKQQEVEAAPLIGQLKVALANAKNPAEVDAITKQFGSSTNPFVQSALAGGIDSAQTEQNNFASDALNRERTELGMSADRFNLNQDRNEAQLGQFANDLPARIARGDINETQAIAEISNQARKLGVPVDKSNAFAEQVLGQAATLATPQGENKIALDAATGITTAKLAAQEAALAKEVERVTNTYPEDMKVTSLLKQAAEGETRETAFNQVTQDLGKQYGSEFDSGATKQYWDEAWKEFEESGLVKDPKIKELMRSGPVAREVLANIDFTTEGLFKDDAQIYNKDEALTAIQTVAKRLIEQENAATIRNNEIGQLTNMFKGESSKLQQELEKIRKQAVLSQTAPLDENKNSAVEEAKLRSMVQKLYQ